jgi:hypothetical protein
VVPEEHPGWQGALKLLTQVFQDVIDVEEEHDVAILFDDMAVVAIPTVQDDEGVFRESVVARFTTQKAHAQVGMLRLAMLNAEREFLNAVDGEEED